MKIRLAAAALSALLLPTAAHAGDTIVSRLHGVDAKIVEAFTKDKMDRTVQVREHFAGMKLAKIEDWAKKHKLDPKGTVDAVHMIEVLAVKPINTQHAWILVTQCNIGGIKALKSAEPTALQQCIATTNERTHLLKAVPDATVVTQWVADAKTAGAETTTVAWSNTVSIDSYYKQDTKVEKALKKAKLTTNVQVFEKLNLGAEREKFAKKNKVDLAEVDRYAAVSDLTRLQPIEPRVAHLIFKAGFNGLGALKSAQIDDLEAKLKAANEQLKVVGELPKREALEEWVKAAKPFPNH